jgi:hypothetical protein
MQRRKARVRCTAYVGTPKSMAHAIKRGGTADIVYIRPRQRLSLCRGRFFLVVHVKSVLTLAVKSPAGWVKEILSGLCPRSHASACTDIHVDASACTDIHSHAAHAQTYTSMRPRAQTIGKALKGGAS